MGRRPPTEQQVERRPLVSTAVCAAVAEAEVLGVLAGSARGLAVAAASAVASLGSGSTAND
eukprot:863416-Lingulodinium_polyedra.AAC.1